MRKPNRVIVCALATYSKIGGLQNFNQRILRNLARRSVEANESPALGILLGDGAAALPSIDGLEFAAPRSELEFLATALWASLTGASALVLCHINLLPLAIMVRLFRPRLPIILFVHGCEAWKKRPSQRLYENWLIGAVTRIVSVSRFTADRMAREYGIAPDKFRFLPNAVDPLLDDADFEPEPFTILTVARLDAGERQKNVHEVIAAVAQLRQRLPGVRYEVIGGGALLPELQALAATLGISGAVTFSGEVGNRALQEAYARAAVFAMPSDKEGFGIVYLEAWQYARPVICSTQGAASEIVSDGVDGFVVDPTNIALLTDRLHQLLTQPELAGAMGKSGRQKVVQKYLNANFRQHLEKVLDELLTGPAEAAPASRRSQQSKF